MKYYHYGQGKCPKMLIIYFYFIIEYVIIVDLRL